MNSSNFGQLRAGSLDYKQNKYLLKGELLLQKHCIHETIYTAKERSAAVIVDAGKKCCLF